MDPLTVGPTGFRLAGWKSTPLNAPLITGETHQNVRFHGNVTT